MMDPLADLANLMNKLMNLIRLCILHLSAIRQ